MFVRLSLCGIAAALALGACSNGSGMLPASSASAAAQSRPLHCIATFVVRDPCLPNFPKTLIPGRDAQTTGQAGSRSIAPPHAKTLVPPTPRVVSRHS